MYHIYMASIPTENILPLLSTYSLSSRSFRSRIARVLLTPALLLSMYADAKYLETCHSTMGAKTATLRERHQSNPHRFMPLRVWLGRSPAMLLHTWTMRGMCLRCSYGLRVCMIQHSRTRLLQELSIPDMTIELVSNIYEQQLK